MARQQGQKLFPQNQNNKKPTTTKNPSCLNSLKRRKRACKARWHLTICRYLWVLICEMKRKSHVSKGTELFCTSSICLEEHAARKGKAWWTIVWSKHKKTRILFFLSKVMLVLQEIELKGLKYLGLTKSDPEDLKLRKTCERRCDLLKTHCVCTLKCYDFPDKQESLASNSTWTLLLLLRTVDSDTGKKFWLKKCSRQHCTLHELKHACFGELTGSSRKYREYHHPTLRTEN